jgi:hypothetical protein
MLDLGIAGTPRGGYNKNHLSPAAPPGSGSFAQSAPHNCVREAWAPRGQDPLDLIVQEVDDMNMSDELGSNETWARPATPRANRPAVQLQQSGVMQQVLQQPAVQQVHHTPPPLLSRAFQSSRTPLRQSSVSLFSSDRSCTPHRSLMRRRARASRCSLAA